MAKPSIAAVIGTNPLQAQDALPPSEKSQGWQQQKSAMARERIVAAAVECLTEAGYIDLTLSMIAEKAGLSRGAMQYHFGSKLDVVKATVEFILVEHLRLQETYARTPNEPVSYQLHRRRVETLWRFMKAAPFTAFLEIAISSRNDPELRAIVRAAYRRFTRQERANALKHLPEWQSDIKRFEFVGNLVATVLEGMAMRQMCGQSTEAQDRPIRDHLARTVGDLFDLGLPRGIDVAVRQRSRSIPARKS